MDGQTDGGDCNIPDVGITIPPGRVSKIGNGMQHTMHSYVCGINLRSESSLVLSDLHFV